MASYLERVSTWCGDDVGIGVGEPSIRAWFKRDFNQDASGRWLTLANRKLVVSPRDLPSSTSPFCEIASAEGAPPVVRILGLEFTVEIMPSNSSRVMETVSIAWRALEASVIADSNRAGRLRYEYKTHTGAAATRLTKAPDIAQLIQGAGLTAAEYDAAVNDMVQKATQAAFATVMLRQAGFPDYRTFMMGIQIGSNVSLTTIGSKVWLKGAPRIDTSEFISTKAQEFRVADEIAGLARNVKDRPQVPEPGDQEAERKGLNFFVPGSAYLNAVAARLPQSLSRLRGCPTGLAPTQGMLDLSISRKSLSFQSHYGVAGADPFEWSMTCKFTGSGTLHASQFELCSETSPNESTVIFDTGDAVMRQYIEKLGTGTPIFSYRVRAPKMSVSINPLTVPIQNNGTDSEVVICIYEAFGLIASAANLPWLRVDDLPFHDAQDEITVLSAPKGVVLSRGA